MTFIWLEVEISLRIFKPSISGRRKGIPYFVDHAAWQHLPILLAEPDPYPAYKLVVRSVSVPAI